MEGETFELVYWKIGNLRCWNQDLHGKCIETTVIYSVHNDFKIKLYPRGTSGLEELMVVYLSFKKPTKEISGDLSFITADGSTLCTQRVHSKESKRNVILPTGPKFEEVIDKTRENKSDYKDQLTLKLQVKNNIVYDEYHVCTSIQVSDVTMEVDRSVLLKEDLISYIRFHQDDCDTDLYLNTGKIRENKKIEFYLQSDTENTFLVKTNLSLTSSVGSSIRIESNEHIFHDGKPWVFSDSLSEEEMSGNVKLIFHFMIISGRVSHTLRNVYPYVDEVKILPNRRRSVCKEKSLSNQENAVDVLLKELMRLYQEQDFSDLQLKCQSVSFPVHRNILSARSTIFKTMLSSDMAEPATGCVDITDLEAPTLSRFLAFLYNGAVEDLQGENALKLYYAADKYNVPSLKRECVSFLSANVCVSNVCDVLSLADKHQDEELTAAAQNFILRKYNEVLKSKEWKRFMCDEPLLAVKTLTDFAEKDFVVGNLISL